MAIRVLLEGNLALTPEDAKLLVNAYEDTLRTLMLKDREDPLATFVAQHIIKIAKEGERDPVRLRERTLARVKEL